VKFCAPIAALVFLALPASAKALAPTKPHNVLLFVADGLRYDSVTPRTAPTLWNLKRAGVDFANPHALFPTVTTVNASAIATGHYIGDTGNFGNQLYAGFPSPEANGASTPFLENDAILGEMNEHFGGNYLSEQSLLAAARKAGFQIAAIGKTGATAIQDVPARDGVSAIIIDDAIGTPAGSTVSPEIAAAMKDAGLPSTAPKTAQPNNAQEQYLLSIATRIVLPKFKAAGKPFILLFWSRDPDSTEHGQKDSVGILSPGINGPTSHAGIKDADDTLAGLLAALKTLGLDRSTDVFVTADHGFSVIDKHSQTSAAARYEATGSSPTPADAANASPVAGQIDLPPGFLAIDLADAFKLPLFDPNTEDPADHKRKFVDYGKGEHPANGNALIGKDQNSPDIVVTANGGSDLIYLPGADAAEFAKKVVAVLASEDYVGGIFTNDSFGKIPGALPISAINLSGSAITPHPDIVVSFASHVVSGCKPLLMCAAEVADTSLATGQGMHGSFSRADTKNFMAAAGPDFKQGFADSAPVSNADIAPTLSNVLGIDLKSRGYLKGRVITEALKGGKRVAVSRGWLASMPGLDGQRTVLDFQRVGSARYFDAAGRPGRTVGLAPR